MTPGIPTPPAPAPPGRRGPLLRLTLGCATLLLLGCVGIAGFAFYENWQQEQSYNAGHLAYTQADCATATDPLSKAASGNPGTAGSDIALKAEAELQECEALLGAERAAADGQAGEALAGYSTLLTKYPDSPLAEPALAQAQDLSAANAPADLAHPAVCISVDILVAQQIVADDQETLPALLFACGQAYAADSAFSDALILYDRVRSDYPDFDAAAVQEALASAAVAEARALGAGALPAPQAVGSSGEAGGQVTVVIQNDSPERLRLVFSGPQVRVEELEPCTDCASFTNANPGACPELGPIGRYVLDPGTYDVVVKAVGGNVNPFSGSWTLESGQEYNSCFYLVTSSQ